MSAVESSPISQMGERESVLAGTHELLQTVRDLERESLSVPVHWNTTSPVTGAALMTREMKRRYAELDEPSLEALATNLVAARR